MISQADFYDDKPAVLHNLELSSTTGFADPRIRWTDARTTLVGGPAVVRCAPAR